MYRDTVSLRVSAKLIRGFHFNVSKNVRTSLSARCDNSTNSICQYCCLQKECGCLERYFSFVSYNAGYFAEFCFVYCILYNIYKVCVCVCVRARARARVLLSYHVFSVHASYLLQLLAIILK